MILSGARMSLVRFGHGTAFGQVPLQFSRHPHLVEFRTISRCVPRASIISSSSPVCLLTSGSTGLLYGSCVVSVVYVYLCFFLCSLDYFRSVYFPHFCSWILHLLNTGLPGSLTVGTGSPFTTCLPLCHTQSKIDKYSLV